MLGSDSGSFCAVYPTSSSAFFPLFFLLWTVPLWKESAPVLVCTESLRQLSSGARNRGSRVGGGEGWVCSGGHTGSRKAVYGFSHSTLVNPISLLSFSIPRSTMTPRVKQQNAREKNSILNATPTRVGAAEEAGNKREGLPPFVKKSQRRSRPCTSAQMTQRGHKNQTDTMSHRFLASHFLCVDDFLYAITVHCVCAFCLFFFYSLWLFRSNWFNSRLLF